MPYLYVMHMQSCVFCVHSISGMWGGRVGPAGIQCPSYEHRFPLLLLFASAEWSKQLSLEWSGRASLRK